MKNLICVSCLIYSFMVSAQDPFPSDKNATHETINLFRNLINFQEKGIMFGHQDDLAYGTGWVYENGRSDVKDAAGDYPAVYGWELGHLELGESYSLDSVHFDRIREWIKTVYERGGVNTISWHLRNPLTGGTSWDISSKEVVKSIIPGGEKHEYFNAYLDMMAQFLLSLKTDDGTFIPVLFRPYHEHTGSWFWWGRDLSSVEDYKALWRHTVTYLQQEKNIHHVLYSYSTDRFTTTDEYLERYPGDDVIDLLGFDLYDRGAEFLPTLQSCAGMVSSLAKGKGKIAAVTESGGPIAVNHQWWTQVLEKVRPYPLSYLLVWRNPHKPGSHGAFAPYKGSPDSEDFIEFYKNPHTIFQKEVTNISLYGH